MEYPRVEKEVGFLEKAPVVYSVVVVRFPIETQIGECISEISKNLKPDFVRSTDRRQQAIQITGDPQGQKIETKSSTEYVFHTPEKNFGFTLKEDLVFIHSSQYPGFDTYSSLIKKIVSAISGAVGITHYNSVGIRYIDAIVPDAGKGINEYLKKFMWPHDLEFDGTSPSMSHHYFAYDTALGKLILKGYHLENEYCIPPDLQDTSQLLIPKFETMHFPEKFAIIDTDYIYNPGKAIPLEPYDLVDRLDAMHTFTTAVFMEAVTEQALEEWRK